MSEVFVFTKLVDMSALYEGISIPVAFQATLFEKIGFSLNRGDQKSITIEIRGYEYAEAIIKNQWFDSKKYPNRADIVQIRYPKNGLLAKRIRSLFPASVLTVNTFLSTRAESNKLLVIPENEREYISLWADKGKLRFECISRQYEADCDTEEDLPQKRDAQTSVYKRSAIVVDETKKFANGVCQLCGNKAPFVDKDGNPYLEVHHIIWLSRGGSDKLTNTIALCPNCHSKMHVIDSPSDISLLLEKAKLQVHK